MDGVNPAPVAVAMVRDPHALNPPAANPGPAHAGLTGAQKLIRQGHQLELLQQAKVQCDRQDYVDLTIYCEDGVVRAHQMLLATASPFLKLLFQNSPLYGVDEISLILPEVKACLVQALIHFVYTGTVVSKEDHFYSLMKLVYALNINASIEAESTNEKPTAFGAPLATSSHIESPAKRKFPHQSPLFGAAPPISAPPLPPVVPHSMPNNLIPQLPTLPVVSLPTHPVPQAKIPRLAVSSATAAASQHSQTLQSVHKVPIQLPTQPVPLSGMVNGSIQQIKNEPAPTTSSYIAIDPNTGLQYKVEVPNGPMGTSETSDPLAAIMNETIFTDSSGASEYCLGNISI